MVTCEGEGRVPEKREFHRRLNTWRFGCLLLALLGVNSCRSHSSIQLQPAKSSQAVVQQPALTGLEAGQEKSCSEFVQGFYDWYFDRLNRVSNKTNAASTIDGVLRRKPMILTVQLARLLKEDVEAAAKSPGEIVGLDFDPFINAQDWEGKYSVQSVTIEGNNCRASVWGTDSGAKREIVDPELNFINGQWVFANFHYPGSSGPRDENLIDMLMALRNDRAHPKR
jgi:Protein of unknown function (DUF3828)